MISFFAQAAENAPDAQNAPWWVLILVGAALVAVIVSLVLRSSARSSSDAEGRPWKEEARSAYRDARWLLAHLTDEYASWRGDGADASDRASSSRFEETSGALADRTESAQDHLFALAADAPDPRAKRAADRAAVELSTLRAAVDERSAARAAYRSAADDGNEAMATARAREVRATATLFEARASAQEAVDGLADLIH